MTRAATRELWRRRSRVLALNVGQGRRVESHVVRALRSTFVYVSIAALTAGRMRRKMRLR